MRVELIYVAQDGLTLVVAFVAMIVGILASAYGCWEMRDK